MPLLVGLVAIPIITRALGPARFGLLALIWAMVGYFGVLDFGLGRAATRFVAASLARGDVPSLTGAATFTLVTQTVLGIVAGLALALLAPALSQRVLAVPPALQAEATAALRVAAATVPLVGLSLGARAILEGARRFDLVNWIRTPAGVAVLVLPAVAAPAGVALPGIVLLLFLARVATAYASLIAVRRALPGLRWDLRASRTVAPRVLGYGAWVAVSNVLSPLLTYLERFILSARVGVESVAYYAAPYEAVTRLLIVPSGVASAVFPALGTGGDRRDEAVLQRWLRYVLLVLAPPVIVLIVFARPVVRLWLGEAYAPRSGLALAILGAGVLANGLAHLPYVYLLARDRPDLPAKFHALELPLYVVAAWQLVGAFGVAGAAAAWTLRVLFDAVLLGSAVWKIGGPAPARLLGERGGRGLALVVGFGALTLGGAKAFGPGLASGGITLAAGLALAAGIWYLVFDPTERDACRSAFRWSTQGFLNRSRTRA
jgi:O-antigen/teichoic acid export membrane protein